MTADLVCISPPAHSFLNSTFANVPRFVRREATPLLQVHPDDAAPRAIVDGMPVRVGNALGEVTLTAKISTDVVRGTVLAPGVWWAKLSPDGRNINQVTPQTESDMGGGACFYDVRVWVLPVTETAPSQTTQRKRSRSPPTEQVGAARATLGATRMTKLHLDTDLGGDIDDLCALAMVLNWPEVDLLAVTTESGGSGASCRICALCVTARRARRCDGCRGGRCRSRRLSRYARLSR